MLRRLESKHQGLELEGDLPRNIHEALRHSFLHSTFKNSTLKMSVLFLLPY
jgi:hypothetical protein